MLLLEPGVGRGEKLGWGLVLGAGLLGGEAAGVASGTGTGVPCGSGDICGGVGRGFGGWALGETTACDRDAGVGAGWVVEIGVEIGFGAVDAGRTAGSFKWMVGSWDPIGASILLMSSTKPINHRTPSTGLPVFRIYSPQIQLSLKHKNTMDNLGKMPKAEWLLLQETTSRRTGGCLKDNSGVPTADPPG